MLGGMYSREALQHNPWIRWWMSPFPHRSGWTLDLRRRVSPSTNYWTYPSHSKPIRLRLICTAPQAVNMGIYISIIIKSNTQTQRTTLALFCRRFLVFFSHGTKQIQCERLPWPWLAWKLCTHQFAYPKQNVGTEYNIFETTTDLAGTPTIFANGHFVQVNK